LAVRERRGWPDGTRFFVLVKNEHTPALKHAAIERLPEDADRVARVALIQFARPVSAPRCRLLIIDPRWPKARPHFDALHEEDGRE
jgi:hypothetical protein